MLAITRLGAAFRAGLAARNQARRIPHSAWKDALREVVVLQKTENALKAEISTLLARSNLGSQMLVLDDKDIVLLLKAAIEREGSISAFARRHGLNRILLTQVVNRKRPVSSPLVKALGLRRVYAP